jgi:hypothetical protein
MRKRLPALLRPDKPERDPEHRIGDGSVRHSSEFCQGALRKTLGVRSARDEEPIMAGE